MFMCVAMSDTNIKHNNSVWTDTKGIAEHFNLKPATIRKQRSRQIKNQLPSHKIGGQVRYNVIECEKAVEATKNAYQ
jgi:hypothetical protein